MRGTVGFPHLPENFSFAEHHRIEARSNAKKVAHGFAIVVMIQGDAEHVGLHGMKLTEEGGKPWRALVRSFRRDPVHLAAVAGRKHQRFLENAPRAKLFGSAASLLDGEGNAFAHLKGRSAMIQSNENDLHAGTCSS